MPPPPLRTLLLTEATLKLLSATLFIASPSTILTSLTQTPPPHSPLSTSLIRALGTQTLAFAVPLLLAARSDARSAGSRNIVYYACLAREGFLRCGLLGSMLVGGEQRGGGEVDERAVEEGRVAEQRGRGEDLVAERSKLVRGMWFWVAELAPFVVGRAWILGRRGEWFE